MPENPFMRQPADRRDVERELARPIKAIEIRLDNDDIVSVADCGGAVVAQLLLNSGSQYIGTAPSWHSALRLVGKFIKTGGFA